MKPISNRAKIIGLFFSLLALTGLLLARSIEARNANRWQMTSYTDGSYSPQIVVKSNGLPCIVWTSQRNVYLRCWDGQEWRGLEGSASEGGISDTSWSSLFSRAAIDADDLIYVAWSQWERGSPERYLYVKRWNGSAWEEVGEQSATSTGISDGTGVSGLDMAVAPDNSVFVVWADNFTGAIYGKQWRGRSWQDIGENSSSGPGISDIPGSAAWPTVDVDAEGNIYVVWQQKMNRQTSLFVKRFDGSQWRFMGEGPIPGSHECRSTQADIAVADSGTPYLLWICDGKIQAHYWDGRQWLNTGRLANGGFFVDLLSRRQAGSPKIAVDAEGRPYAVWYSSPKSRGYNEVYARYWTDGNWVEMGSNSAAKGGVSNQDRAKAGGHSWQPALIIDQQNRLYLAWEDQRNGITEIFVRYWTDEGWSSIGNDGDAGRVDN